MFTLIIRQTELSEMPNFKLSVDGGGSSRRRCVRIGDGQSLPQTMVRSVMAMAYQASSRFLSRPIPEVWLLDIQNRQFEIYRQPLNSVYEQRDCRRTGQIAPILYPDAAIDLAELFPNR